MNKKSIIILLAALILLQTTACDMSFGLISTITPTSTSTPEPTLTSTATNTPVIPTATKTRQPSQTSTPTDITEWNGIPIMEGAYDVEIEDGDLTFWSTRPVEEIEDYYIQLLQQLGWVPFATGTSASGPSLYMFQKDGTMITFTVIPLNENQMVVLVGP